VHVWDQAAGVLIHVGGQGVIIAVLGICVYLAVSVLPLFESGGAVPEGGGTYPARSALAFAQLDEYRVSAGFLSMDGSFDLVDLQTGRVIDSREVLPSGKRLTAWSRDAASGYTALGFDDGTVQLGTTGFESEVLGPDMMPESARDIEVGRRVVVPASGPKWAGVAERLSPEQFRVTRPILELRDPVAVTRGSGAIRAIDYRARAGKEFMVVLREDGSAEYELVRTTRPLGGGKPRVRFDSFPIVIDSQPGRVVPDRIFVLGDGTSVLVLWNDGTVVRLTSGEPAERPIVSVETFSALTPGSRVCTATMLLGGLTLMIGDDAGWVSAAFVAVDPSAGTSDGGRLVTGHRFRIGESAVTSLGVSPRDRSIVAGDASGRVVVRNVTSEKVVVDLSGAITGAASFVGIAPKMDGLLACAADGSYRFWELRPGHPEASFKSLFGKVQYEGLPEPRHVYQSSSGEDVTEVKLGLIPLIVGTLKATIFAMLFATPIAVLAAIYTSEFMHPSLRTAIKPAVEMMASLPSVVLGFIAAMIVAPYMSRVVPAVLVGLGVVPVGVLLGAHLWQLVPIHVLARLSSFRRMVMILSVLAASVGASALLGPVVERTLFVPTRHDVLVAAGSVESLPPDQWPAWVGRRPTMSPDDDRRLRLSGLSFRDGAVVRPVEPTTPEAAAAVAAASAGDAMSPSLRRWLDGNIGVPWPGWLLLLIPVAAGGLAVVHAKFISHPFNVAMSRRSASEAATWQLLKFLVMLGATLALAAGGATALSALGLDPRDSFFGPFNQRNTLVVGLIMGFAVIPIIYTISEDAMSSVPASLRSAALGAGATAWQTALSVVLPVAASGVFSACMIGLGRAVGETMIVVMATGNTPTMNWNIFEGFRTLSANIAVELPEAPRDSTHYRALFLCGLVLFAMTFTVNTTAEVVRQRFRRRSASL
jgi:phosphate transport system permease protein